VACSPLAFGQRQIISADIEKRLAQLEQRLMNAEQRAADAEAKIQTLTRQQAVWRKARQR
jgi:hypothetical protein